MAVSAIFWTTVNAFDTPSDERVLQAANWSQPGPTTLCPGWSLGLRAVPRAFQFREVSVTIGRDQALAKSFTKLFERAGWTQGKLAEREGRSPAWVTFRLRFERFLRFAETVSLPADLTERRFRALWAQIDKNTREEELRFRQIIKLLCPEHVASSPIAVDAQVRDRLGDNQLVALWRTRETCSDIARRVGVNPTWLRLQWRRLRCNGKMPKDGRRNARVIREDVDDVANDRLDGRPSLRTRDRLLRQLIAVHVEPRFDLCTHDKDNPEWP